MSMFRTLGRVASSILAVGLLIVSCQSPFKEASTGTLGRSEGISRAVINGATLIEAEDYSAMNHVQLGDCIASEGTKYVGWIDAGDWMVYPLAISTAGKYTVEYRVASPSGSRLSSDLNAGATQLGTVTIPVTGDWQEWKTVPQTVTLPEGNLNFGIYAPEGGWNLNWIKFTPESDVKDRQTVTLEGESGTYAGGAFAAGSNAIMTAGSTITWNNVSLSGIEKVTVYYSNGEPAGDSITFHYAGSQQGSSMPIVNHNAWSGPYTTASTTFTATSGTGAVSIKANGTNWVAAVDKIVLEGSGPIDPIPTPGFTVSGRQILLDGKPFTIKGVCWNPIGKGGVHPSGLDYAGFVDRDATLMQQAGINVVRTYEPIVDLTVLNKLHDRGIYVINAVYSYGANDPASVTNLVNQVKDHPAILMWSLGNEWNYNGIYVGLNPSDAMNKLNLAAQYIKTADTKHLLTTIYGHIPEKWVIDAMPNIDVWGLNVYSGLDFGTIFADWKARSGKPMFMSEYGADAWNSNSNQVDLVAQAKATRELTQLLISNSAAVDPNAACSGGTIFEWADEWWKAKEPFNHNSGGVAPGGGPYPDMTFNEEYWGLVDIDRNPRDAYQELRKLYKP